MLEGNTAMGGLLVLLAVVWVLFVILASFTLNGILRSALYLYASDGSVPHNFDNKLAENAFSSRD